MVLKNVSKAKLRKLSVKQLLRRLDIADRGMGQFKRKHGTRFMKTPFRKQTKSQQSLTNRFIRITQEQLKTMDILAEKANALRRK